MHTRIHRDHDSQLCRLYPRVWMRPKVHLIQTFFYSNQTTFLLSGYAGSHLYAKLRRKRVPRHDINS